MDQTIRGRDRDADTSRSTNQRISREEFAGDQPIGEAQHHLGTRRQLDEAGGTIRVLPEEGLPGDNKGSEAVDVAVEMARLLRSIAAG